jgi:hypothetical protein
MGLIDGIFAALFGGGRNIVVETAQVFRENAEAAATRDADARTGALGQFGAEFAVARQCGFDRFMDGVNRLPRPMLALGTLGLFGAAMVDPVWFAARMQGLALVPEPLWWLMGAIVSFYFGARHQVKGQEFQRSVAQTMAMVPQVTSNLAALSELGAGRADTGVDAALALAAIAPDANAALSDWSAHHAR